MERAGKAIAVAAAAATLAVCWLRLGFGVDFSDEAYYVALPYRFALGDVPFRDELHLAQTAALITWPFVEAFLLLGDGSDGIVLFTRRLFLAFSCCVAAGVWRALRSHVPGPAALAIALLCLAFVPFGIPNFSYNTLGSGLFTLGLFLASRAVFEGGARLRFLLAGGLLHGLATLAYPPLVLPMLVSAGILGALVPQRARALAAYAAGGAAVGAMLIASLDGADLARVYEFMTIRYTPQPGKGGKLLAQMWLRLPPAPILLAGGTLWAWQGRRRPWTVLATLPLLPVLLAWSLGPLGLWLASLHFVTALGLVGPLLLPLVWDDAKLRRLFVAAWVPSACAGLTFAWASTNGYGNAGLGMTPAAVVTLVLLYRATRNAVEATRLHWLWPAPLVGVLLAVGITASFQRGLYKGGAIVPKHYALERVAWGPFEGIRGRPLMDEFLRTLAKDLRRIERSDRRIVFYDHFPAGYLLTRMRPATPSLYGCFWLTVGRDPGFCSRHYAETLSGPSVAVRVPAAAILGNRIRRDPSVDQAMRAVVERDLDLVVSRVDRQQQLLYEVHASRAP